MPSKAFTGNTRRVGGTGSCPDAVSDYLNGMNLRDEDLSEIIEMALSDEVRFADIRAQFGLSESEVKTLMRENLRPGSYRAWRRRVARFSDRRAHYK